MHIHAWQMQKEMWPQLQWVAQGRFFVIALFKARQWTLCNDPLGPEVATPNATAVNASGSDGTARCQRFRLRRGDLLYVPPGWPQKLAHCDTGNQSIEAKTRQNYDMLAIEKMSLPRWVAIFRRFIWIGFRSLAWSHCRSCIISAFDTDLAAFDNARTVAGWFTWRVTQWPPNRLQLKMLEGSWGFRFYCLFTSTLFHHVKKRSTSNSCWKVIWEDRNKLHEARWLGPGAHGLAQPLPLWRSDPALRDLCSSGHQRIVRVGVAMPTWSALIELFVYQRSAKMYQTVKYPISLRNTFI